MEKYSIIRNLVAALIGVLLSELSHTLGVSHYVTPLVLFILIAAFGYLLYSKMR